MILPAPLPAQSSAPYYSYSSFNAFSPVALLYSALAQLTFKLLRKTPWRLAVQQPCVPKHFSTDAAKTGRRKVAIVTGSNTGIGFETSRSLVEKGYEVVLACRSRDKGTAAANAINEAVSDGGGQAIFVQPLDLSSFESVKAFSETIRQKYEKVDVLVNNAGLNTSGKSERIKLGDKHVDLDLCFQANHLGHVLLTKELLGTILKTDDNGNGGGRVINLSSVMHHYCDNNGKPHDYEYWKKTAMYDENRESSAYTPSKLAALLFTLELNRRYSEKGLRSIAVNPGAVNSDIWRGKPAWLKKIFSFVYLTSKQGSSTSVAAATCSLPAGVEYLQPYWLPAFMKVAMPFMEMLGPYAGHRITEPRVPDDGKGGLLASQHMWKASEELIGCEFEG